MKPNHHSGGKPGESIQMPNRIARFVLHFFLPLMALVCGVAITFYLINTSPEARPKKRPPSATLVEVETAIAGNQATRIHAMGEIIPAHRIEMRARVSGEIINVGDEFIPGGYFQQDQLMLGIDPTDYRLVVEQLESEAKRAESDLRLERGNQRIAEKEFSLLNESVSEEEKALILRKPQMAKLEATRTSVKARLAKAKLDLERCEIKSPFNAVVESRNVNLGTKITESTVLASLVGSDAFWLRLSVPVDDLKWILIPENREQKGSRVKIFPQNNSTGVDYRTGHVLRLVASLEEQGRMAQLIVAVDDPLSRKKENEGKPKLLLGSYVKAEIEGIGVQSGVAINRANIHEGGKVWLMDQEGLLDIRNVRIAFKNRDQVIIDQGVAAGERIVISPLASPISGIPLRLEADNEVSKTGGRGEGQRGAGKNKERVKADG